MTYTCVTKILACFMFPPQHLFLAFAHGSNSSHTLQHFLQFTQTLNSSLTDCMHRYFSNKSLSLPYKSSFPLVHLKPHLLCGAITLTEQGGCVVRNSTSPAFSAKETCEELICYVHSLLMFFPKI